MRKSFTKLYIHCVWSTKKREKILNKDARGKIFAHIQRNCRKKDITLLAINGFIDHIHLLIDLNPAMSIAEAVNLIKGESSHWINENKIIHGDFRWQKRYSAFTVSYSVKQKVISYIRNQEAHHQGLRYLDELKKFYKDAEIKFDEKILE
jgi:putative transposase